MTRSKTDKALGSKAAESAPETAQERATESIEAEFEHDRIVDAISSWLDDDPDGSGPGTLLERAQRVAVARDSMAQAVVDMEAENDDILLLLDDVLKADKRVANDEVECDEAWALVLDKVDSLLHPRRVRITSARKRKAKADVKGSRQGSLDLSDARGQGRTQGEAGQDPNPKGDNGDVEREAGGDDHPSPGVPD